MRHEGHNTYQQHTWRVLTYFFYSFGLGVTSVQPARRRLRAMCLPSCCVLHQSCRFIRLLTLFFIGFGKVDAGENVTEAAPIVSREYEM